MLRVTVLVQQAINYSITHHFYIGPFQTSLHDTSYLVLDFPDFPARIKQGLNSLTKMQLICCYQLDRKFDPVIDIRCDLHNSI